MPRMIYGTAWKKELTNTLVQNAIVCGFRAIDTACQPKHYNEKLVGDGIKAGTELLNLQREDIFIQTKFTPIAGQDPNQVPYNPKDTLTKQIEKSIAVSLENLQTYYIDSLLFHSPISPYSLLLEGWNKLETYVANGTIKQTGISNCYDINLFKKLYKDTTIKPKVLQNRFYKETNYDYELRVFCEENEIEYQSFWSLSANPHILNTKLLYTLSLKYNYSKEVIFYRFLTQLNISPLNGTTSIEHMKEDLNIFEFELTRQEINMLQMLLDHNNICDVSCCPN